MGMNIIEYPFISIYQLFRWFKHGWILIVQFFLMFTNSWRVWPIASHDGEVLANAEDLFRGWPFAAGGPVAIPNNVQQSTLNLHFCWMIRMQLLRWGIPQAIRWAVQQAIPIFFSHLFSVFSWYHHLPREQTAGHPKAPLFTDRRWIARQQKHHAVAKPSPLGVWSTPPEVRRSAVDRYG